MALFYLKITLILFRSVPISTYEKQFFLSKWKQVVPRVGLIIEIAPNVLIVPKVQESLRCIFWRHSVSSAEHIYLIWIGARFYLNWVVVGLLLKKLKHSNFFLFLGMQMVNLYSPAILQNTRQPAVTFFWQLSKNFN